MVSAEERSLLRTERTMKLKDWIVRGWVTIHCCTASVGWDCEDTGVQEDGERAGRRMLVKRTENALRGREMNRGQIRAL